MLLQNRDYNIYYKILNSSHILHILHNTNDRLLTSHDLDLYANKGYKKFLRIKSDFTYI